MKEYRDLGDEPEDERIRQIGEACAAGNVVAFFTDSDEGKADRYIAKLRKRFPFIRVVGRFDGPIPNVVTVKVQIPQG